MRGIQLRMPGPALPGWVAPALEGCAGRKIAPSRRMDLAVMLSRMNVEKGTGGPFGAAVFDEASGRLVSAGVNLVVGRKCSVYHAEIVAVMLAQAALGQYSLTGCGLYSSTEPCAMCQGAILWAGLDRLVCGARGSDACAAGFDEGPKRVDWVREFRKRGIAVARDVRRARATAVLRLYAECGGVIYNG